MPDGQVLSQSVQGNPTGTRRQRRPIIVSHNPPTPSPDSRSPSKPSPKPTPSVTKTAGGRQAGR